MMQYYHRSSYFFIKVIIRRNFADANNIAAQKKEQKNEFTSASPDFAKCPSGITERPPTAPNVLCVHATLALA